MRKAFRKAGKAPIGVEPMQKKGRDAVWCDKFGYFIDLDACRARSYSRRVCRRCYASLLQTSLPFI